MTDDRPLVGASGEDTPPESDAQRTGDAPRDTDDTTPSRPPTRHRQPGRKRRESDAGTDDGPIAGATNRLADMVRPSALASRTRGAPPTRPEETAMRGGAFGIAAVFLATAGVTLVGAVIALAVALLY